MSKPDLVSIEPLRPQSMEELARHFTIHQLTMHKSTWVDAVKPLGDRVRFVQTTGFAGCPGPVMAALPRLEIVSCMGVGVDAIDLALVMSVHPGFSGQSFIASVLPKTRAIRDRARQGLRVQMDGGVAPDSAPACRAHGCDLIVAASAIFGKRDYAAAIQSLRG